MRKIRIAILGATSHIAKGLINNFLKNEEFVLHLYARSQDKLFDFFALIKKSIDKDCIIHEYYDDFLKGSYDVVINCVGTGTFNKMRGDYSKYFTITEEYDNLAIKYLSNNHSDTLYVSLSSGVVYGRGFSSPVEENSINGILVNHVNAEDYYSIARINSEAKHRSFKNLKIVDLRIFSYFSRFIDLTDGYFITDLLNSVLNKKEFLTSENNFIRDYLHPDDLFLMIKKCVAAGRINAAFDINSAKPVKKKEILDYFSAEYGLKYKINKNFDSASATGAKNFYYSKFNNASSIGYCPAFNSIDAIKQESEYILINQSNQHKK